MECMWWRRFTFCLRKVWITASMRFTVSKSGKFFLTYSFEFWFFFFFRFWISNVIDQDPFSWIIIEKGYLSITWTPVSFQRSTILTLYKEANDKMTSQFKRRIINPCNLCLMSRAKKSTPWRNELRIWGCTCTMGFVREK